MTLKLENVGSCAARCHCTRQFGVSGAAKASYENSFASQRTTKNSFYCWTKHDTALSSKRVEHIFAQLKKFKILGSTYRNFRKKNFISASTSLLVFISCGSLKSVPLLRHSSLLCLLHIFARNLIEKKDFIKKFLYLKN